MDTLQQMIADTLNKACVEKDEGPEAEILPRLLIVVEGPDYFEGSCQICSFFTQNPKETRTRTRTRTKTRMQRGRKQERNKTQTLNLQLNENQTQALCN